MPKRIITAIILLTLTVSVAAPVLFWPKETKAVFVPNITTVVEDLPERQRSVLQKIWDGIKKTIDTTSAIAYRNAIKYLFNKIAYDFAIKLSTGDKGQQPLFIDQPMDKYLSQVGDEALGEFFDTIGESWGVDLCSPIDRPWVKALIQIRAKATFEPTKPDCTWSEIKKNVGDIRKMKAEDVFQVGMQFQPGANDFGAFLQIQDNARNKMLAEKEAAEIEAEMNQGFKSVQNTITDTVKTPGKLLGDGMAALLPKSLDVYATYTGEAAADAIGLFTNTLTSRLLERLFNKGINVNQGTGTFDLFGAVGFLRAAKDQFAELANPDYNLGGAVDIVNKLSACSPSSSEYGEEQFNCTIDQGWARAITEKLTLREALNKRLIKGGQPFGFLTNGAEPSINDGLPYRSLLILRKYRIIPVAWELAAEYYQKFGEKTKNLTLSNLIKLYDEPDSPYYKLVDPEWQLKAPETICYKEGPGPDIISTTDYCEDPNDSDGDGDKKCRTIVTRRTYCADERSCIAEDGQGKCLYFGYCVEEKPVWKIKGEECLAIYNTCQSLTDQRDQKKTAWLSNTLETCTQDGCSAFCENYDGSWNCENIDDLTPYLVTNTCDENDAGCSEVIRVLNFDQKPLTKSEKESIANENNTGFLETKINLKLPPEFCKDYLTKVTAANRTECESEGTNNYWRSDINACVAGGGLECANYVYRCEDKDAACRLYTPVSIKAPTVAAQITSADQCPAECAGWHTFTQMKTNFESGTNAYQGNLISFIPSTASMCSESGCDEFTNLDKLAAGGESKEYYSYLRTCVKTGDGTVKIFYTWEGSDTAGYQLKKWELATVSGTDKSPIGRTCQLGSAGVDCREFYNPETELYYSRDFASVVFATSDCHEMRRTLTNTKAECEGGLGLNAVGKWNTQTAICTYLAAPSLSTKCSANNAGCRTFRDNSSYNYQTILEEKFEDGNSKWTELSNEAVRRDNHSLKVDGTMPFELAAGDLQAGETYSLTALVKMESDDNNKDQVTFSLDAGVSGQTLLSKNVDDLPADWKLINVDLGQLPAGTYTNPTLRVKGNLYLDEIILKKINNLLVIKNSWTTNQVCENVMGMTSCEAYRDDLGTTRYLQRFSKLCLEEAVGCEAFLQENSAGDREWQYLVYDKSKTCQDAAVGCRMLGEARPQRTAPGNFTFQTAYWLIKEGETCKKEEVGCRFYTLADNQGYARYINPFDQLCEYRQVNGQADWWMTGEDKKCPHANGSGAEEDTNSDQKYCLGGRSKISENNECTNDADCVRYDNFSTGICTSWAGVCTDNDNGCQEYQDPYEPEFCDADLLPQQDDEACNYYYYKKVETVGPACSEADLKDPNKHCFQKTGE